MSGARLGVATDWQISNSVIFKLLGTVAVCYALIKLYPLIILVSLSLLLACAIHPFIEFFERRMPHWAACLLVTAAVFIALAGIVVGVIPSLVEQTSLIAKRLPEIQETLLNKSPNGLMRKFAEGLTHNSEVKSEHIVAVGQHVMGALADVVLVVVMALYLASDGKRTFAWLRAFFSEKHRKNIDATAKEASEIVVAYVLGQLATSVLCGVFVFIVLQILKVPSALVLAVLAAVFDILPMLGFFLFTIPAVLFALTVSSKAAITVLVLYVGYHLAENYFLVPKIYGNRLRLSDLVVLVSVLAGFCIAGIAGAVLILPLIAAYPTIERIWLVNYVGRDVVLKHEIVGESKEK